MEQLYGFVQRKIFYRVRQFGLKTAVSQIIRAAFRPIFEIKENLIFIIPNFRGYSFADSRIKLLTAGKIKKLAERGIFNNSEKELFLSFIEEGSKGLYIEIDGKLAGYAWIQFRGKYRFGGEFFMPIPPNYVVVKNLFVYPQFRGQKIGQVLNQARLKMIPPGVIPVTFIIPENKIAIRNWVKYGFKCVLYVKHWRWVNSKWHIYIKRFVHENYVENLYKALMKGYFEHL